jgi:hypothetical protein
MRKLWLVGLAMALVFGATQSAKADSFYFTISGGGISGTGVLYANLIPNSGGKYIVDSMGYATINGESASIVANSNIDDPTSPDNYPAGSSVTAGTADFVFDDIITPGASPYLDNFGVLIAINSGPDSGAFINLWNEDGTNDLVG